MVQLNGWFHVKNAPCVAVLLHNLVGAIEVNCLMVIPVETWRLGSWFFLISTG